MKKLGCLLAAATLALLNTAHAQDKCAEYPLGAAKNPSALGWSKKDLAALEDTATEMQSAAMMVVQGGEVVFTHGDTEHLYLLHSLRKSIMSALIGVAVDGGAVSLDTTLAQLNIDDLPGLTDVEKSAKVRDVISARSGVYIPSAAETDAMREQRPDRGQYKPGEHWYYNNWDFNVAGHIFERTTARNYDSAFQRIFAEPLCMPDFDVFETHRFFSPGTMFAAYHIRMSARDLALFGQLFLQKGKWQDEQIISESWVDESTGHQSETGWPASWMTGYGYMWWRIKDEATAAEAKLPADMYTGAGYGGHYLTVIPSMDMVIVNRMNTDDPAAPRMSSQQYETLLQKIVELSKK